MKSNKQIAQMALARLKTTAAKGKEPKDMRKIVWQVLKAGATALKAKGYDAEPQVNALDKESGYIRIHSESTGTFTDIKIKATGSRKYGG